MISKNGMIAFDISMTLLSEIEPATIRQMPRGGVNIPMARFVTIITPQVRGSIPRLFKMGATTGTKSIKDAVVSTNVPIISKKRLMSTNIAILLFPKKRNIFERVCCMLFIDKNHEKTVAMDMMISMIALVFMA